MKIGNVRPRSGLSTGVSLLFGIGTCVLVNLPSVKFITLTPLLNAVSIGVLALCAFTRLVVLHQPLAVGSIRKVFAIAFVLMVGLLLLSGVLGPYAVLETTEVGRVVSLLFAVPLVLLCVQPLDVRVYVIGQVCWSVAISLWQMTHGFAVRADIGLHYLNLGLGIAGGLVAAGGIALFARKMLLRLLAVIALLICFAGLLTLYGRAPIFFSSFVVTFFAIASSFRNGSIASKVTRFSVVTVVIGVGMVAGIHYLAKNWYGWARIERAIYSTSEEPRMLVLRRSAELLLDRPVWGSGLNAAETVLGHYPHNIFLDVAISAGVPALMCLIVVVALFARVTFTALNGSFDAVVSAMIATYFFMTWNVSFTIGNSYVLFGAMAVAVAAYEHTRAERIGRICDSAADSKSVLSTVPCAHT